MLQTLELTLPELLARYNSGEIPRDARVQVTFEDNVPHNFPTTDPLLNLLDIWAAEDADLSPEQTAENERVASEIEKYGIPRVLI